MKRIEELTQGGGEDPSVFKQKTKSWDLKQWDLDPH